MDYDSSVPGPSAMRSLFDDTAGQGQGRIHPPTGRRNQWLPPLLSQLSKRKHTPDLPLLGTADAQDCARLRTEYETDMAGTSRSPDSIFLDGENTRWLRFLSGINPPEDLNSTCGLCGERVRHAAQHAREKPECVRGEAGEPQLYLTSETQRDPKLTPIPVLSMPPIPPHSHILCG